MKWMHEFHNRASKSIIESEIPKELLHLEIPQKIQSCYQTRIVPGLETIVQEMISTPQ